MTKLHRAPPPPVYPFGYATPPKRSGNTINGLGNPVRERPVQVFHNTGRAGGRGAIDWGALDMFFNLTNPWPMFWENVKAWWVRRNAAGPVAKRQVAVDDPAAMAAAIKAKARSLGAHLVGISRYDPAVQPKGIDFDYARVVSLGHAMDRDEMLHAPYPRAAAEVMRTYRRGSEMANRLARHIRALGWRAEAYGIGEDVMQIPMAINGGLGQLGKHGSMISKEHGSNFRLTCVLTDLPMALDRPVDIGVDDLCASCTRCVSDCPPAAIFDTKQMVRGETKWYVDFDKCIMYFTHTHGCAICIEVCPWSEPGRGPLLAEKLLAKRARDAG